MKVNTLLKRLATGTLTGDGSVRIKGATHDSRRAVPGNLFVAVPGEHVHGVKFVDQAIAAGAAAVLSDRRRPKRVQVPWIQVKDPRPAMAAAAWILAGSPHKKLRLIGVTGTNGKSTTASLIGSILEAAEIPAAVIGTLGARLPDGSQISGERTTPEATDLAPILRSALKAGAEAVVMEVSSHALSQHRVHGLEYDVAVWTNLTRDHLDYHGDMDTYFNVKCRLFTEHLARRGSRVLPVDDPWGARLLDDPLPRDVSWGLSRGAVSARSVVSDLDGSRFDLRLPDGKSKARTRLIGVHNLRNALAAAAAAHAAGCSAKAIRRGLKRAKALSGRLERIATRLPFPIFVDYAHTPEGLREVLRALGRITDRRLIVVFGAGGDRDRGKRGPMGYAVGELADVAIVTSDNPRTEDPVAIADAVAEGVRAAGAEPLVELDRRRAIALALRQADDRSLVLVAGKGHEATQTIGDEVIPFSDQQVLRAEARGVGCD
jgi:UDP-N-acetylmuramoyl-L-alanyl-D-glutamate--2,6-diaminopimelate ligase